MGLTLSHNPVEFLVDFGQFYPENGKAQHHTRIITSPIYTKTLLEMLRESIDRYEQSFGAIPEKHEEVADVDGL